MEKDIIFDLKWSDKLEPQSTFIDDFVKCVNMVFDCSMTHDAFKKKYIDNIYGPSLLTVVYIDGEPSAVDAMWRNDLFGEKAYQTIDTCVLENCRGLGIFREITKREIETLGPDVIIYGYPNKNSYPGYIKFNWKLMGAYHNRFFFGIRSYLKEHPKPLDYDYAKWWLGSHNNIFSIEKNGVYLLLKPTRITIVYHLLGITDIQTASLFPSLKDRKRLFPFLIYSSLKPQLNKKHSSQPVVYTGKDTSYIPLWKLDTI